MGIPVLDQLQKAYVGDAPIVTPEVPRVSITGSALITDAAHWGRFVEVTGAVNLDASLSNGFWCFVRNNGSASITLNSTSPSVMLFGVTTLDQGQIVQVVKYQDAVRTFLVNATDDVFPPTNFVSTSSNVSPSAGNSGDFYILTGSTSLTVSLPPSSTAEVGLTYFAVVNETVTNAASFVNPATGDRIAGEVAAEPLFQNEGALFVYAGNNAWRKILEVEEAVIPPWPVLHNNSPTVPLDLTAPLWASSYQNSAVTGGGTVTLPPITSSSVAAGSGVRFVATASAGFGLNVRDEATETIQNQPAPNTISPDLSINQGQEAILFKKDTTSTEWGLFYLGVARATAGGDVQRISAGVTSWAELAGAINQNNIVNTLDGFGVTRGVINLPENARAVLDNITVSRGDDPTGTITSFIARRNGPRPTLADYALTTLPTTGGTFFVLVERPNEIVSVTSDGTGANITLERVNSSFADRNEYKIVITSAGTGATAITLNGGPRQIHHIALNDRFSLDGSDILGATITEDKLDAQIIDRLITPGEREDHIVLARNIIDQTVVPGLNRDRNRKIISRFAGFFINPTTDGGSFPTNLANDPSNISVTAQSAANTRLGPASTLQRTGGQFSEGPSIENGGFSLTPTNQVLDLTTNLRGIVIGGTWDANILGAQDVLWDLGDLNVGLVINSAGRLAVRIPRASTAEQTQTRTFRQRLQDDQGRDHIYFTVDIRSDSYVLPATLTGPLTGTNSVEIQFLTYFEGIIVGGPQVFLDIPDDTVDVAEQTQALDENLAGQPTVARYSYTASTRRINVSVDAWTSREITVRTEVNARFSQDVTIPAGVGTQDIEFDIPDATRYTIFCHLFRESSLLNFQLAVNGRSPNQAITAVTGTNPVGAAFQNPVIRFGGADNFSGFAQKFFVGQAVAFSSADRLSNRDLAGISGNYATPFYGLISPSTTHKELVAAGVRWQASINNGGTLPGSPAVETFFIGTLEDDFGRPPLPAIDQDVIDDGVYEFRVLIKETISTREYTVDLPWHQLGLANGQADYRVRFSSSIENPVDNEIVVSGSQLRINTTSISGSTLFTGRTVTAELQIVLK